MIEGMSVADPADPEVAAVHFDERAIAEDLASWCDGRVVFIDGESCVRLPAPPGRHLARPGDWIVRLGDGEFIAMGSEEFAARMEPRPTDNPLQ
jgi:hypothetical protein